MNYMSASKPRVEERVSARMRAPMRDSIGERDISILDVSSRGLLATAQQPPRRGEFIELQIGRTWLAGHIRWVAGQKFGLALQERINVTNVVGGAQNQVRLRRNVAPQPQAQGLWGKLRTKF